jgi:hypothetical protein
LAIKYNIELDNLVNFSLFHYLAIDFYDFFYNFESLGSFKFYKHNVIRHKNAVLDYNKSLLPSQSYQHNFTADHTC